MKLTTRKTGGTRLRRAWIVLACALVAAATLFAGGVLPASATGGSGTYSFASSSYTIGQGGAVTVTVNGTGLTAGSGESVSGPCVHWVLSLGTLQLTDIVQSAGDVFVPIASGSSGSATFPLNANSNGGTFPRAGTLQISGACSNSDSVSLGSPSTATLTLQSAAVPFVSSINPPSGTVAGGTAVTVAGTGLAAATGVTIGGTNCAITGNSATAIQCTTGAHAAGSADVIVTTGAGSNPAGNQLYQYAPGPTVTGLSASTGPGTGGTLVVISGTGFMTGGTVICPSGVNFGAGHPVSSCTVTSDTSISAISPAGSGVVDVLVTNGVNTSPVTAADKFTYAASASSITSVSPAAGGTAGGNTVTITGTGLTGATSVTFGTFTSASISSNTGTSLNVIAPAGTGGPLTVMVNLPSNSPSLAAAYTYTNGPVVTGISPATCPTAGGQSITVSGFNFSTTQANNTVTFGGTAGTVTFANVTGTSLNVTCPARAAGTVDVIVTVASVPSPAVTADQITYANTGPAVSSIFPTTGPTTGGTLVTVTGQNFTGATQVLFGGVAGTSLVQISATQVSAISPAHLGGATVDVQVTTAQGTSPANPPFDSFTYADTGAPVITSITPTTDAGICGQVITVIITGSNFTAGGSQMTVLFGGVAATSFTVNGTTQINAILPPHAPGAADVRVTVGNGAASFTLPGAFTYTCAGAPTVTGVSPSTGAPGITVTITGTGFTGVNCPAGVTFGGVQASACTVVSDSSITATVPTNVPSGTSDVRVTNASGQSAVTAADQFTNSQSGATFSYTLYPTFTLIGWAGQDGITAKAALSGPNPAVGNPPTTNVSNVVTVIWRYDASSQTFKAYFPGHDTDGLSDFTTLQKGVGYFIGMAPGTPATTWTVVAG